MTGQLIVVSNRLPMGEGPPQGGLVVALHEALSARGGHWIGAHPEDGMDEGLTALPGDGYTRHTFRLTAEDREGYYLGYANSVLWPLFHRRVDLLDIRRDDAEAYHRVNARVARALADLAGPDDRIWVQDYHFLPLAAELRRVGSRARIGFFLHIPFPVPSDLAALPERAALPGWLSAYDVVGLQTRADVARALELFRTVPDAEVMLDGRIKHGARRVSVRAFPIGIDAEAFAREASAQDGRTLMNLAPTREAIVGVDRLDYSKGLPQRFEGYAAYLAAPDRVDPPAMLLQIAPPSRQDVAAYREIREELEGIAGRVNGAWGELDWTPIRYIHRALPRATLAVLYRAARVGLVTPLADGMNLVAKEYVAAQDPDDPGVLVLSHMAGAAEQLTEALLVNPYDPEDIGGAISRALAMPLEERRARHARLRESVFGATVGAWAEACLAALEPTDGRGAEGDAWAALAPLRGSRSPSI
ncbi:MAG: alpha,alpha-trehalose-phosphate synthase (UDP-forming) [Shimia sp.]